MFSFLIPLIVGFLFNLASAFTSTFSKWWGERRGSIVSIILRDVLGIPVWTIGFLMAFRLSSRELLAQSPWLDVLGWLLMAAGGAIILIALWSIRTRSLAPSNRDSIAEDGIYSRVRHPIHSGTLLEFAGLFLVKPTETVALTCALGVVWILLQTLCEEHDLLQRMPGYREYMRRVPRFIPLRK
jgi:protein-S-isoprenylcysteine O-methyltransferase Ste14